MQQGRAPRASLGAGQHGQAPNQQRRAGYRRPSLERPSCAFPGQGTADLPLAWHRQAPRACFQSAHCPGLAAGESLNVTCRKVTCIPTVINTGEKRKRTKQAKTGKTTIYKVGFYFYTNQNNSI